MRTKRPLCCQLLRLLSLAGFLLAPVAAQEAPPRATVVPETPPRAKPVEEEKVPPVARPVEETKPTTPSARPVEERPAQKPSSAEDDLFNLCYMLYKRELNAQAVEQFTKFINAYPNSKKLDAALTYKGECYLRQRQVAEAIACYTEVIRKFKSGQWLAYSSSRIGTLKFNESKFLEAAPYFRTAAGNAPKPEDKVQYYYNEGLAYKYADKSKEAANAFELATGIKGVTGTGSIFQNKALLELGRLNLDLGKKTAAFDIFERIATTASGVVLAEAQASAGLILLDERKYQEALPRFQAAAKSTDAKAARFVAIGKFGLIKTYYALHRYKECTDAWANGFDIASVDEKARPEVVLMVGNAYRLQDNYARALDLYTMLENFFGKTPEAAEAGYRRIHCLHRLKDPRLDAAVDDFVAKERARDPGSANVDMALLLKAEDNFTKKKYQPAAKAYAEIRLDKVDEQYRASILYKRGWAQAQSGNHAGAVESLTQYIDKYPKDAQISSAMLRRAHSLMEINDLTNSIKDFDAVAANYPGTKEAEEAYRLGGLLRGENKDFEGMIKRLNEMLEKFPQTTYLGECKFWIGTGHWNLQQYAECIPPLSASRADFKEKAEDASRKIIMALAQLDRIDELATEVDAYYKTYPKPQVDATILSFLGQKRYDDKNYVDAARFLGFASTAPSNETLKQGFWYLLADSRSHVQDHSGAVSAVDKFISMNPPGATNNLYMAKALLIRGTAHLGLSKLVEAKQDADKGLALGTQDGTQARLHILRGKVEFAAGNFQEAAQNFIVPTTFVKDAEIIPEAYTMLLRSLDKLGMKDKYQEYLAEFEANYPEQKAAFDKENAKPKDPQAAKTP